MSKSLNRICPVCDHNEVKVLSKINLAVIEDFPLPKAYDLVACSKCGHVFNDVAYTEHYNDYYSNYQEVSNFSVPTKDGSDTPENKLESRYLDTAKFIGYFGDVNKNDHILDVGCSYGGVLLHLQEMGHENLYGMDLDRKSLEHLNQFGIQTIRGSIFDEQLDQLNGKFDLIILGHILEHLERPRAAIENVEKWLKPNGKIVVEVPDLLQYPMTSPFPGFFAEHEHINHFSLTALMNLMQNYQMKASYANRIFALIPNFPCIHAVFEKSEIKSKLIYSENDEVAMRTCMEVPNQYGRIVLDNIERLGNREVILWGAGMYAYRLMTHTAITEKIIIAVVDKSKNKHGKKVMDIEIQDVDFIKKAPHAVIVICSTTKCDDILRMIKENQFENEIIVPFIEGGKYD